MSAPVTPREEHDHSRLFIIAATLVALTCIISCSAVLIVLILRFS